MDDSFVSVKGVVDSTTYAVHLSASENSRGNSVKTSVEVWHTSDGQSQLKDGIVLKNALGIVVSAAWFVGAAFEEILTEKPSEFELKHVKDAIHQVVKDMIEGRISPFKE